MVRVKRYPRYHIFPRIRTLPRMEELDALGIATDPRRRRLGKGPTCLFRACGGFLQRNHQS